MANSLDSHNHTSSNIHRSLLRRDDKARFILIAVCLKHEKRNRTVITGDSTPLYSYAGEGPGVRFLTPLILFRPYFWTSTFAMKKVFFVAFALLSVQLIFAQTQVAEISRDAHGVKVVKGFLNKQELSTDTAFAWFPAAQKTFTPNASVVKKFAAGKDAVQILIFGGTWCEDTQMALPKFLATTDAAGFTPARITLIGVDRSKKTLFNLSEAFAIKNVPTFIVMKDGREVGRVVEFGTTGYPENEVAELVAAAVKK